MFDFIWLNNLSTVMSKQPKRKESSVLGAASKGNSGTRVIRRCHKYNAVIALAEL